LRRRTKRRIKRRLLIGLELAIIAFALVLAAATWILVHALAATGRLSDARDDIDRVRQDLIAGRDATSDLAAAEADARAAQRDTHDFVWSAGSWLPPMKTMRGITSAINTFSQEALPDIVRIGPSLQPAKLRIAHNRIALAPLHAAAPTLARVAAATARARDQVAGLPAGWIGPLTSARDKVLAQLSSLAGQADDVRRVADAGPAMLGEHGLRRYFVAIQNNAEARATGGLVAAYAIVTADHGTIRVVERGNDSRFRNSFTPVVPLPAGYRAIYGNYLPAQKWITSNLSPNFPVAASIWAGLWQAQSGQHIDGAFGVDPYGLADLLGAIGPVQVHGYQGTFTRANLAPYIESGEYAAFQSPADQSLRKQFLSTIAGAVLHKMLSGAGNAHQLVAALGHAAGGGHLELWSRRPAEEAAITGTPLAGEIPGLRTPFVSLSIDSGTGSKLDYYLDRSLAYRAGSCSGATRVATITVRLTNTAPRTGLPPYVRLRGDLNGGRTLVVERVPRNVDLVWVHATAGAALLSASLDGHPVLVSSGVESGKATYGVRINLDPGVPRTLTLRVQEPVLPGPVLTQIQPMALPQRTNVSAPVCA
jgi:hypothetical protein